VDKKALNSAPVNWVKLDESGRIELRDPDAIVVVSDTSGRRVGVFIPDSVAPEYLDVMRSCPITQDEWERRDRETGGRPLSEILKSLGQTA
jgi:hypothetical protein